MKIDNSEDANKIDNVNQERSQYETKVSSWTFFKAGWRPALGWLSVAIVFYSFIIHPALIWWVILNGYKITIPMIDSAALLNLVAIVIGVGAMRTYEKVRFNEMSDRPSRHRPSSRPRYNEPRDNEGPRAPRNPDIFN